MLNISSRNLLVGLITVVLLGLVIWSAQRTGKAVDLEPENTLETSLPSQNWKTFNNSSFKYNFKYPADLNFVEDYALLESSDQLSLAYKPGEPEFEVRFALKVIYPGYLDGLPVVKEALAANNLQQFAQYIWESNANDLNPDTKDRVVGELEKTQVGGREAFRFTVNKNLTLGLGEPLETENTLNYVLNNWQEFKREYRVITLADTNCFFIVYYPLEYAEGPEILKSLSFEEN